MPDPLIEGVLDLDATAMLYGPSGSGKSFVALDWALCVATGIPWHGHDVIPQTVLYVVGEGLSGTRARYQAWKKAHGLACVSGIIFAPRAVNILTEEGRLELLAAVVHADPRFTILDTVARHIPGGDENSFEAMSRVVQCLDTIKDATRGCALAVHHSGKDEHAGARGHSSLKGAVDTEIQCVKGPRLTATKQKNHEDGHIIGSFRLEEVGPSMVLREITPKGNANDEKGTRALGVLGGEASYTQWREQAAAFGLPNGTFPAVVKRLVASGQAIPPTDTTDTNSPESWYRLA